MAGMISITDHCHWYLSNRGFTRALDEIIDALAASQACPSLFAYLNDPGGTPQCVGDIDLRERSPNERIAFLEAARQACQRLGERDPKTWRHFEPIPEFLEHMRDLVSLLEAPRDTRPDPSKPRDPDRRPNAA